MARHTPRYQPVATKSLPKGVSVEALVRVHDAVMIGYERLAQALDKVSDTMVNAEKPFDRMQALDWWVKNVGKGYLTFSAKTADKMDPMEVFNDEALDYMKRNGLIVMFEEMRETIEKQAAQIARLGGEPVSESDPSDEDRRLSSPQSPESGTAPAP